MKFTFWKRRKFWLWLATITILLPILIMGSLLLVIYLKQDAIIQGQIETINQEHLGLIEVGDTHLEPFENFPYISIKVDDVRVYETKADSAAIALDVADIYVGFDFRDIVGGNFDIHSIIVEDGFFNIILHEDGTNNIQTALATTKESEESTPINIHLQEIQLRNLDIHKYAESSKTDIETYIYSAKGGFKTKGHITSAHIDTEFELNVINDGDTSFIKHKHFEAHTDVSMDEQSGLITFQPSGIIMEHGDFELEGSLDTKNEMYLDLAVKGTKPNFDMLIAFAPEDVIPTLERYKNAGKIYFNAIVQGPTTNGQNPFIDANFGATEAYLENTEKGKRMEEMGFKGHFTNGNDRHPRTMEFSLTEMKAKLEEGKFLGSVMVRNFEEPEIDMQLDVDFNLEFLAGFLNLNDIQDASGSVALQLKFHDIIDLNHPEHALNELNQAYFSELKIENLHLASADLPAPLKNMDVHLIMNGKKADLDQFEVQLGESNLSITGYVSDLPAIVHHTNIPVTAHLEIKSAVLDVAELTGFSDGDTNGINERIEDLTVGFSFQSSARAITESKYLPQGEFFIDSLHAQLKHYPHELHDFHADILIDDRDLMIQDFTGFIDDSDFHFNGLVHDYGFWMQKELNGDVDLDITLKSDLLRLEDLFSYQGENYVPEDYRHEEFDHLVLHANSSMHFRDSQLHSIDLDLDQLSAKMHVHTMRFEDFSGRFHYEDEHLVVEQFHGKMGRTAFDVNLNYYLGNDPSIRKRDNHLSLNANYIDFDQLFNFNPAQKKTKVAAAPLPKTTEDVAEHAEAFNLYELPFTDMTFDVNVGHLLYHQIGMKKIVAQLRTTQDHYLYVDTLHLKAAGGKLRMSGYFNGSDPKHIYMKPNLILTNVDIDKLLFKFERYGQDIELSKNLHGRLFTRIKGNIRVYPDFVPDLDQSEIHMDVRILNGRLVNYEPMALLSDYMGDKDLTNIRFDTLQNRMDFKDGELNIPSMTIESTLGHFEVSGKQDINFNMEYYLRVPWKLITQGTKSKLFGGKKDKARETGEDEIVEVDPKRKTKYLNLKIEGNADDYNIKLGKDKKSKG